MIRCGSRLSLKELWTDKFFKAACKNLIYVPSNMTMHNIICLL